METATENEAQQELTSKDVAIRVSGLSKRYLIGGEKKGTLTETLAGMIGAKNNRKEEFWALQDINFEVRKGEVIGIIGKNGAGKSTLLKILSRITQPTTGKIEINGRVASLLEVGTGFHPELTGRENIYLNGTILGMSRQEVKAKFEEIVEFSGVRKFIDTPVKHYSSGMYVRLAFAVAAHLEPEILIIDEVLAVGDAEFQRKCLGKMKEVAGEGRTVLFVSHNMMAVKSLCDRVVLIENGKISFNGTVERGVEKYLEKEVQTQVSLNKRDLEKITNSELILLQNIILTNDDNFSISSPTNLEVLFKCSENFSFFNLSLVLSNKDDQVIFNSISPVINVEKNKLVHSVFEIPANFLNDEDYRIRLLFVNNNKAILDLVNVINWKAIETKERDSKWFKKQIGLIRPNFNWKIDMKD